MKPFNALLVYPQYPDTFWSMKHALKIISKKANFPPLGLLTVASMLPKEWNKKLIDMNVAPLEDKDLDWADYIFISAMVVQRESTARLIERCKKFNKKIVAGGPLVTSEPEKFSEADYLVLDEAEITLQPFLEDLEKNCAKHIYSSKQRPDLRSTPLPMWSLLDIKKYATMSIQYSRGCPFDCEFCDIIVLNGRKPRQKTELQVLKELQALYERGWRGGVFVVDDNFIGNKIKLKEEVLPAIINWQQTKKYPFVFATQVSINLSDDEELMELMVEANFDSVFVGIESVNEDSLQECNKHQNKNRDLIASVTKMLNRGFQVQGGFIVGFDSDPADIFQKLKEFVQKSGIVMAMTGLLQAPRGTRLYKRLEKENRLLKDISGDNTEGSMNFIPKMDPDILQKGYQDVMFSIYSPKQYYGRIEEFFKHYKPRSKKYFSWPKLWQVKALIKSMWVLNITDRARMHNWIFLFSTLLKRPKSLPKTMGLMIQGLHFRIIARKITGNKKFP